MVHKNLTNLFRKKNFFYMLCICNCQVFCNTLGKFPLGLVTSYGTAS